MPDRFAIVRLFWVVLPALAAAQDRSFDWPRWRGAHFDGASRQPGVFHGPIELRVAWRAQVGSGYSAISVLGDRAVTMGSDGETDSVIALDASTGETLWRHAIGPTFPGQDGAQNGPVSTPTLSGDSVYALAPWGHLLALELRTGEPRWSTHLAQDHGARRPHWGFTTAPLVKDELVIVQTGGEGRAVTAFDRRTGEVRWRTGTAVVEYQSPILADLRGVEQLVCAGQRLLFGVDPTSGELLWSRPHGGRDFYQRIVNPLSIGDDRLLLKNRKMGSMLVRLVESGADLRLDTLWSSRNLKGNYSQPLLFGEHIYGYNGSFLTCIAVATGERLWRSRPPGNGWPILVDGHLVVLTRAGGLFVATATPEGYDERAQLELFDRETWTPPSFANGQVFARESFGQAACVEVVPVTAAVATVGGPQPLRGRLAELARELESAVDGAALVNEFMESQDRFPIIEGDRLAHIVFEGDADDLVLIGDMAPGGIPMARLAGTEWWAASIELRPDARIGYRFVRNLDEDLTDPLNPMTTSSLRFGEVSELLMPDRERTESDAGEPKGRFVRFDIDSPQQRIAHMVWGGPRTITVYLPPGYADGAERYPTLYVNDGRSGITPLGVPVALDRLARDGHPTIGVFIPSQNAYELARSQRAFYQAMVLEQVVRHVDGHFRTRATADDRGIIGFDEGGYGALALALRRTDVFGFAGVQSVYLGSQQGYDELAKLVNDSTRLPTIHLDWGRYDVGHPQRQIDIPRFSRAFTATLRAAGARVSGGESADGATFACWRERLPALLRAFAR